ncbi:DUF1772 domain-containing protein [Streptomyces sp. 3MP-14]|uniref:DUF1772 domain-containing protein n=1 Tax=Streptomyces mimosae TaxID=2586635 RepID=A0A5N5ZR95_9ACTN|nr:MULTISPECIES: anthrone oxygenase family protein [Streptomyces]KAB8158379.1 DUF1772 domain-containing protein [Streptomyces mimosae]KAB8172572.1 DUF1772 domain-containing protein [Streptomyces sp. 3MP-14]
MTGERLARWSRWLRGVAVLCSGLLAGAFGYGALSVAPTFREVPLELRLSFHAELMRANSVVMQSAMVATVMAALAVTALSRGRARLLAGAATALAVASLLITRLGNVPINGRIRDWVTTGPPPDHAEQLARWEAFNNQRSLAALTAFALLLCVALAPKFAAGLAAGLATDGPSSGRGRAGRSAERIPTPTG